MKIKAPSEIYIEKAKQLTDEEAERVLSRMGAKLRRRKDKDKIECLEALAMQLELEDEMLMEWREQFAKIQAKEEKKATALALAGKPAPQNVEPIAKQKVKKAKAPDNK